MILGGVSGETMPKTAVIPQGGSITISGTGLYLVKMNRNSVTTIVQNAWKDVYPVADTFKINNELIRFDKILDSLDFTITDLTTNTNDFQRTISYRKLWY